MIEPSVSLAQCQPSARALKSLLARSLARSPMRANTRERPHGTLVPQLHSRTPLVRVTNSTRASLTTQRALKRGRRAFRLTRTSTRTRTDDVHFRSRVYCASRKPCHFQLKQHVTTEYETSLTYFIHPSISPH